MIRYLAIAAALLGSLGFVPAADAQSATLSVNYAAGWNMLGGPAGLDLSSAAYLYGYGASGYFAPSSPITSTCQGFWAYFNSPAALPFPVTPSGQTQTCALQAGWTMVGNPFGATALLPAGVTGYYWDPATSQYQTVTAFPPGSATWIYSTTGGSVTLTSQSVVPPTNMLVISDLISPGPFQVHVGDEIELLLPSASPYTAKAEPTFNLRLEGAGVTGPLSCNGTSASNCALSLVNQFWLWKALAAGNATISVTPQCAVAVPACTLPSQAIAITIVQ